MPPGGHDIQSALALWPQTAGATAQLLSHSENQIFELSTPSGQRYVLRLHRAGYQSRAAIESELAWLTALKGQTTLFIPRPLAGHDGNLLQSMAWDGGERRYAVLFDYVSGVEPSADADLAGLFHTLGVYAATLHRHASCWQRPDGFERPIWQASSVLPSDAPWGDWRLAPGLTDHHRSKLEHLSRILTLRLADYGQTADRFGLIHADMRLGNLLIDGDRTTLIDFDDCGFSWFLFDFAAAISFHETSPSIPVLKAAWLSGYQTVRQLTLVDIAMIDTMVMLRRMALLAWIGSHAETRLAQTHVQGFADDTLTLADRYLSGALWQS